MQLNKIQRALMLVSLAEGCAAMTLFAYGPLYMRQVLGESSLTIASLALGLSQLTIFLFAGVWGRLGDFSGRPLYLVTGGLTGASVALLAMSLAPSSLWFLSLIVVEGIIVASVAPLGMAWMTTAVPEQASRQAARYYRARALGWALGSLGSGYLVRMSGPEGIATAFQFCALLTLVAAVVLGIHLVVFRKALPQPTQPLPDTPTNNQKPEPHQPSAWRQPLVLMVAVVCTFAFGGYTAFSAMLGPYLTEHLNGVSSQVGLAIGIMSMVTILTLGFVGRLADQFTPARILLFGLLGYTTVYSVVTFIHSPLVIVALLGLPCFPFLATGATGVLAKGTTDSQRGEAMGIYEASAALGGFAGSLVSGLLADIAGLALVPILCALLFVVAVGVAWFSVIPRQTQANKVINA